MSTAPPLDAGRRLREGLLAGIATVRVENAALAQHAVMAVAGVGIEGDVQMMPMSGTAV